MYPLIFYVLKCLIFKYLLKIANISAKIDILSYIKSLESEIIAVPLLLKCVRNTIPQKLFDNIDSDKAGCDRYRFLGLYAVCPYAI